ncbi:MAG: O-antigen ligase family protein [Candidatus Woesearchaeota archaeon]
MFVFFIVPLIIWIGHFKPFVAMKNFIFIAGILIVTLLYFIDIILKGQFIVRKDRLFLAVIIYYLLNLSSFFLFPFTDGIYFSLLTCLVLMFYIIAYNFDEAVRDKIIYVLFAVSFISSIYGFFQYFGIDYEIFVNYFGSRSEAGMRTFTTFGNPNILGGFSVFIIPLLIGYLFSDIKNNKKTILFSLLLLLNISSLLMSQTRGSWIAALASIFVFIMLYYRNYGFSFVKRYKIVLIIIGLVLLPILIYGLNYFMSSDEFLDPTTANIRLYYYKNTLNMITESPSILLFGRGLGSFNVHYPLYRDNRIAYQTGETQMEFRVEHPHNEHLEILHDIGLIGYFIFLWIIFEALLILLRKKDLISLSIAVSIIGILIDGLFSQNLRFIAIASLLWLAIGISAVKNVKTTHKKYDLNYVKLIFSLLVAILFIFPFVHAFNIMNADSNLKNGISYYISDMPDYAVYEFEEVLSVDRNNKRALYYLAHSYSFIDRHNDSLNTYKKLLSIDPNFIQTNYRIGVLYIEKGDFITARDYLLRQIRINNMYWQAYYALAYLTVDNPLESLSYLEEIELIHKIGPNEISIDQLIEILKLQAQLYAQVGDLHNALRILYTLDNMYDDDFIKENIVELERILNITN